MPSEPFTKELPLPKGWKSSIKSAVIHTLSLPFKTITLTLGRLSDREDVSIRTAAQLKRLKLENAQLKQFLSVSIFEKTPISEAFSQEFYKTKVSDYDNQLLLFNL